MNWDSINTEAITHLQNLIRINTTNPPGNEIEAVRYISQLLDKENIPYQIFEPAPGRANLIARLKGKGDKRPLLLTSHLDVVPAEESFWTYPPFSGVLEDGSIWGRGAIDMKQMTAMELMIFLMVHRHHVQLPRDLILACVADEEAGSKHGAEWLVINKPGIIDAEYALNEVGGFSLHLDGQTFYPIGVAEKGLCWFKVTVHGLPGHGSLPHQNQALVKLAHAANKLGSNPLRGHTTSIVRRFIVDLARFQNFSKKMALWSLMIPGIRKLILTSFSDKSKTASFTAMLHNTATPTVFHAGSKINVIPTTASMEVDGRILPGQTIEKFLREVQKVLGPGFQIEIIKSWEPADKEFDDDFFLLLSNILKKHDPDAIPIPYLIPGFTDAAHYSRLGIKSFGFAPVKLDESVRFADMFHGHNERIPVEGFLFGLKVLWEVVNCA